MQLAMDHEALRKIQVSSNGPVILVPTMGALHAGHLELFREARVLAGETGTVIASIFVNPTQFDRPTDLANYPRPLEMDLAACRQAAVDVVFLPAPGAMYFSDHSVHVSESLLSKGLCGATRPGHFDGVCTVVLKLFLLTRCDIAIFGEKDFQQCAVVRRLVRDLNVPVMIREVATVREADGLAMSSRNARLTTEQRADAPRIFRELSAAARGFKTVSAILTAARAGIAASADGRIDYLELVDAETLQPCKTLDRPAILAAAVFYGEVRLIDHVRL